MNMQLTPHLSAILFSAILLSGCGGHTPQTDAQTGGVDSVENIIPVADVVPQVADSLMPDTLPPDNAALPPGGAPHEVVMSDVEAAYEEGAAQAEEDRLSGNSGANFANDYDIDEENDAYEEGYEDD